MSDIGQRISQLIVAQWTLAPIGKPAGLVNFAAGSFTNERFITYSITKTAHHSGNLRVKKRFRNDLRLMEKNFNILATAVHDFQHIFIGQQPVKRGQINTFGQRVNHRLNFLPCRLDEANLRPKGFFTQKLSIDGDITLLG